MKLQDIAILTEKGEQSKSIDPEYLSSKDAAKILGYDPEHGDSRVRQLHLDGDLTAREEPGTGRRDLKFKRKDVEAIKTTKTKGGKYYHPSKKGETPKSKGKEPRRKKYGKRAEKENSKD